MNSILVRLVGGCAAGKEVWHDSDKYGPIIRMLKNPDFPPEVTAEIPDSETFEQEEYLIHLLRFDTNGHRHYYAAPARRQLVDLMNEMWDGYKTDADMERRNGH